MKTFHAIIDSCSLQTVSPYLVSEGSRSVLLHIHLFHGCGTEKKIEFGFLKLYKEFSKDGIRKYFKAKYVILYVVIF